MLVTSGEKSLDFSSTLLSSTVTFPETLEVDLNKLLYL